ncbi:MAG: DEAD/DEAH box helicase [Planctomycetes bacterium]|nr:DEAD/DEAH box helicase [Planctomycetota bacterium]
MTTSVPSDSEDSRSSEGSSQAFELLHERVQEWIWRQNWTELRDAQERAIRPILERKRDLVIAAATAAGKTEAAFLPICSELVDAAAGSVRALYVSPLKALINDQFRRLEELCEALHIPVHRWHGDVGSHKKRVVLEKPSGILLITPESLEAIFVNQGHRLGHVFPNLDWVVLDELHAYIGSDRGRQVQSLLHRLETRLRRRTMRIGLSATLGDMGLAAEYLRPRMSGEVDCIVSESTGQSVMLQIRGYTSLGESVAADGEGDDAGPLVDSDVHAISRHLLKVLRGTDNLVFANSRRDVETYADLLRRSCERQRFPNEFLPHHGNLSKELREDVEARLKDTSAPMTAICTSTLEMGIDIGQVSTIAQIRAPFSVASLRQRLGRSGRRGEPSVLRIYISESEIREGTALLDQLRPELVQSVAMTELLIARWCEPPEHGALHLSTLIHQTLAMIAERGGCSPKALWQILCSTGPFQSVSAANFKAMLRTMAKRELVTQAADGDLVLGEKGEKIVNHFSFFAVFPTPEEFRVVHNGQTIGRMSSAYPVSEEGSIIFGGRRWRVISVDMEEMTVVVAPAGGGCVPRFEGQPGGLVHDVVRQKMRVIYEAGDFPSYLNEPAKELLVEGRRTYVRLRLDERTIVADGKNTMIFLCRGDRIAGTLAAMLTARGVDAVAHGPAIQCDENGPKEVETCLGDLVDAPINNPSVLAESVVNKRAAKYDWALDDELLSADYASRAFDIPGAIQAAEAILG